MSPTPLLCGGMVILLAGAASIAATSARRRLATVTFLVTCLAGCALAAAAGVRAATGAADATLLLDWSVPGGSVALRLDALGGWFAFVVGIVCAPVAVYALAYFRDDDGRTFARFASLFNVLVAALLLLASAQNGLCFLAAWELMTVSAYLLIVLRHADATVRSAGRLYFVANHVAAFCLLALVALLGASAGSLDFDAFRSSRGAGAPVAVLLVLALVAFGTKAGVVPFHIWLPHAHPAAPTPVSAVLSGVLVKSGVFGLLRFLAFLPEIPTWAGVLLLLLGVTSGVMGVLYALAQHDLKRLLAYHTVENIGIIVIGAGVGVIAARTGHGEIAAIGFCGALLHLCNHALFKSLLFLGAGTVVHATGTGEMDHLGGLARRMPWTALTFLVGCVSICALPPANGFVSEWLVYRALFGEAGQGGAPAIWSIGALLALALIGGLAAACFAKAFSATFLGQPRGAGGDAHTGHAHGEHAGDAAPSQRVAMGALALACVAIGVMPQIAVRAAWPAAAALAADLGVGPTVGAAEAGAWLVPLAWAGAALIGTIAVLTLLRRALGRRADAPAVSTWGCGYSRPNARMQYTASSFAAPLVGIFRSLLRGRASGSPAGGAFAPSPHVRTWTPDGAETWVFRPAYGALVWSCERVRTFHRGPIHVRVAFVLATLGALLLWKVVL